MERFCLLNFFKLFFKRAIAKLKNLKNPAIVFTLPLHAAKANFFILVYVLHCMLELFGSRTVW